MSHVLIAGQNISRHWLQRNPWYLTQLNLCVLLLIWDHVAALNQIEDACEELVRRGEIRKLPDGRYCAI